ARQAGERQVAPDAPADARQRAGERDQASVLGLVARFAPAPVIPVLLATALVASRGLQMPVVADADPDLAPRGRDGEGPDPSQGRPVAHRAAVRMQVAEYLAPLLPRDPGSRVRHVSQPRRAGAVVRASVGPLAGHHADPGLQSACHATIRTMSALRFLAAALQRLVDRMDPQEGRYRMLFEHSPLPMWVVDVETQRFLGVNEAAVRLYGYGREAFLAMTPEELRVPIGDFLQSDAGAVVHGTFRHLRKGGEPMDIDAVGHLVMWRGRAARLVVLNDITERKRTQQELQRLNRELEDRVRSRTAQLEAANKELEA